jgi:hypothetical protein
VRRFRYYYNGSFHNAFAYHITRDGVDHYRVILQGHLNFSILNNNNQWIQATKPGETLQDYDLLQALGQGLYEAGISNN